VKDLAQKHKCTTGKWLMPVDWSEADEVWTKLVQGLLNGKFSDELGIYFIRIFGRETSNNSPHCLHRGQRTNNTMITIYTRDWTDQESTLKIAEVARGLGLKNELLYKADAYTVLDIYRHNVYNLRPTIYKLDEHQQLWLWLASN
jgi:Domain of unknown function (DUF1917)